MIVFKCTVTFSQIGERQKPTIIYYSKNQKKVEAAVLLLDYLTYLVG